MNWRRGFSRLHVVGWIGFALVGASLAVDATQQKSDRRTFVREFMSDNPRFALDGLRIEVVADQLVTFRDKADGLLYTGPDSVVRRLVKAGLAERVSDASASEASRVRTVRLLDPDGNPFDAAPHEVQMLLDAGARRADATDAQRGAVPFPEAESYVPPSDAEIEAREIVTSGDMAHPLRVYAPIWGLWLLVCGLGPWLLKLLVAWIAAGFSASATTEK